MEKVCIERRRGARHGKKPLGGRVWRICKITNAHWACRVENGEQEQTSLLGATRKDSDAEGS